MAIGRNVASRRQAEAEDNTCRATARGEVDPLDYAEALRVSGKRRNTKTTTIAEKMETEAQLAKKPKLA